MPPFSNAITLENRDFENGGEVKFWPTMAPAGLAINFVSVNSNASGKTSYPLLIVTWVVSQGASPLPCSRQTVCLPASVSTAFEKDRKKDPQKENRVPFNFFLTF